MRSRTKIIAALLLLAVIVGWPVIAHFHLKNKVAEYRRQLVAQGEKMTVAELRPLLPADQDNGASSLVSAVWQAGSINSTNQPPAMRVIAPGRALVAWQQQILPTSESTNVWPGLRKDVEAKSDALSEIRAALEKPALAFNLDYSQGVTMLLTHLSPLKRAAQWLSAEAVLELHEGRATNAVENLRAMTALVARYKDEPVMISFLVRAAIAVITVNAIWEALQSPEWNDKQLAELQAGWKDMDFLTQAEAAISMERVIGEKTFADVRATPSALFALMSGSATSTSGLRELLELGQGVLEDPGKGWKELVHRYPGYWAWKWWWSYEDELVQMQYLQAGLVAIREMRKENCFAPALKRCAQADEVIQKAHPKAGGWFDLGINAVSKTYLARLSTIEMQRHLLVTAIALKRFQLRHRYYPDALTALVPEFCREPPRDPIDGQPLRYRLQADGSFLLYSVGENGVDDSGDPSPPETEKLRRRWLKGRDVVWPQAASPQETLLYQLEAEGARDKERILSRIIVTNGMPPAMLVELERLAQNYHFTLTNSPPAAR